MPTNLVLVTPVLTVITLFTFGWSNGALADHPVTASELRAGEAVYNQTCVACHGSDGQGGVPGAPDMTASTSPLSKPEQELITNVTEGFQSPGSAMAMPPKGGNPTLDKQAISDVVHYMRREFLGEGSVSYNAGEEHDPGS